MDYEHPLDLSCFPNPGILTTGKEESQENSCNNAIKPSPLPDFFLLHHMMIAAKLTFFFIPLCG